MLHRPRLAEVVAGRWDRRVTALVAGAGFGKTGLLVEALAGGERPGRGHDAWVACQQEDERLDRLFEALFVAVRGEPPREPAVDVDDAVHRLADAVWSRAPLPVALVLDDLHLLPAPSPGADLLSALVRRLPGNAHFVLASRTTPPIPLTRLLATGDAALLRGEDLAMTAAELAEMAARRGRPDLDLSATGGWPALAELAIHTGTSHGPEVGEYLLHEVLVDLPSDVVHALAVLATVGPLSGPQLAEVLATGPSVADEVTGLPLVAEAEGRIEVHSLWDAAVGAADPERVRRAEAAAARVLLREGDRERAFRLALAGGDPATALDVLAEVGRTAIHSSTEVDLDACVRALPPEHRGAPAAVLAAALAERDEGWPSARARLEAAVEDLGASGATSLELVALTRLGILAWQAGDLSVADRLLPRVGELASSGDPLAAALVHLGTALLAEVAGDTTAMWDAVAAFAAMDVPEPLCTAGARYRASLELVYGDPADAARLALEPEEAAPGWLRTELRIIALWGSWHAGDRAGAHHWAEQLHPSAGGTAPAPLVVRSNRELLEAWAPEGDPCAGGRVDELAGAAARARRDGLLVPSRVLSLAAAARLVAAGDEARAASLLSTALEASVPLPRSLPAESRALALVWVLVPEQRERLAPVELGAGPAGARRAARLLVEARGDGSSGGWRAEAARELADPALPSRLPAAWVAELAARHVGARPRDEDVAVALEAVDRLGPAGPPALRRLAARGAERALAAGASAILGRRTPVSEGRFVLRLLGPAVIEHDGEVIDHPDWRRDRVRGLFALIARHGSLSRRSAAEALWPDLDPDAAANNLRVTLSYLQKVLEPERTRHEVAYHVRSDGPVLRFTGRSSWTVDVEEVERLLDTAERDDARGEAAVALEGYLAALGWCRGPYLDDVTLDATDEVERERLRSRQVRALLRAGALLLAVGRVEEAQRLAVAAEAADPWSEQALCLQVECYVAVGDAPAALRTHRRAAALVGELGLPTSPDLRRVEALLRA